MKTQTLEDKIRAVIAPHIYPIHMNDIIIKSFLNIANEYTELKLKEAAEKAVSEGERKAKEDRPSSFEKCKELFESYESVYKKELNDGDPHDYAHAAGYYHAMLTTLFKGSEVSTQKEWISVKEKPLYESVEGDDFILTNAAEGEFIGAVPVFNNVTKETSWEVHHYVIEDEVGLCVVGEDGNEPAGWGVEDIELYMPIPKLPDVSTLK